MSFDSRAVACLVLLVAQASAAEGVRETIHPDIGYDLADAARLLGEAMDGLGPIEEPDLYLARGILRFGTRFSVPHYGSPLNAQRGATWAEIDSDFRSAAARGAPAGHYYRGFVALEREGDWAAAAEHLRAAWNAGNRSDDLIAKLIAALLGAGDYAALRDFLTPVVVERGSVARFHALATANLGLSDLDNAILWGERALATRDNLETRMLLGGAYYTRNDLEAARIHFERARDYEPDRKGALTSLLRIYIELDRRDHAAAVVDKLRESFPEDANVQELLLELAPQEQGR